MDKKIPEEIVRKAIALKLLGHTNKEIAKETGISTGSVSNITANLAESLGTDTDLIIDFFHSLRKIGLSTDQILQASDLAARFKKFGLSLDDTKSLLGSLASSKEKGVEPQMLVEYASQLFHVCESLGIEFASLPGCVKKLEEEVPKKQEELLGLGIKITDLKKEYEEKRKTAQGELDRMAEEKKKVLDELEEYQRVRGGLKKYNISIKDTGNLATMLDKAKQDGLDIKRVRWYLKSQDTISSLGSQLSNLESEYKKKHSEFTNLQFQIMIASSNYNDCTELLPKVKELAKSGVTTDELLFVHNAIQSTGISVESLGCMLGEFGNLHNAIEQTKKTLSSLKSDEAELGTRVETLRSQKSLLEASIDEVNQYGIKKIQDSQKEVVNSINDVCAKSEERLGFSQSDAKAKLEEIATAAKRSLSSIEEKMEQERQYLVNASIEFGKIEAHMPILKCFKGEQVSREEFLLSFVTLLDRFKSSKTFSLCSNYLKTAMSDLVTKVRNELATGAI